MFIACFVRCVNVQLVNLPLRASFERCVRHLSAACVIRAQCVSVERCVRHSSAACVIRTMYFVCNYGVVVHPNAI